MRGDKQKCGPMQPALGKSLAEDLDVRWQADVIHLRNQPANGKTDNSPYTSILVCVNCFTRALYARPRKTKTQQEVKDQMREIFKSAPRKPQVISTDSGQEFKGTVSIWRGSTSFSDFALWGI